MRYLLFTLTLVFLFACGEEKPADQPNEAETTEAVQNEAGDPRMERKTANVTDREPEIEMVNIDWVTRNDTAFALYKAWIQYKDSKYYLIDGRKGAELYFELTGGHPELQLIIIDPEEDQLLNQTLGTEPLVWNKQLEHHGTYRFMVQINPKFEGKEDLKTYLEAKMRMY